MEKTLPVITISRQYAAYGTTIAAALSKRLDIPWYDKDFVKKTAIDSGYDAEEIAAEGEEISRGSMFLNSMFLNPASYSSSYDTIFEAQKKVILELAQSPCIIIGRCADHILKQEGIRVFRVFLHGDAKSRLDYAKELNPNASDVMKILNRHDTMRENYYKKYTGTEMGDSRNYDITLDVPVIGVDACVDAIESIVRSL